MRRDGLRRGMVTLCIGGGEGIAVALKHTGAAASRGGQCPAQGPWAWRLIKRLC
jgi:hypothetical protein